MRITAVLSRTSPSHETAQDIMRLPLLLTLFALGVRGRGAPVRSTVAIPAFEETVDLPEGFIIGAGTSAFQVEGSPHADGKGPSVLDEALEKLQNNVPEESPDSGIKPPGKAADSYRRYKEDVQAAKDLKLQVYRFSVSWSRVLPDGDPKKPNQAGIDYYNNLINDLVTNNIQPMVTMNHYDLPAAVKNKTGGWTDERIVQAFTDYADVLFENFGDRVQLWTTVNEPNYYCMTFAVSAMGGVSSRQPGDDYKCVHHVVLAHMRAYRLYERKYKAAQKGRIGTAALALWAAPNSTSYDDIQAAERSNLFMLGIMYHPVVFGDYPPALRERVNHYSAKEGLQVSRLPYFTDEEKQLLKGSTDFLCFNAYMGSVVADSSYSPRPDVGTMASDRDAVEVGSDTTPGNFGDLLMRADPKVLREAPMWIHEHYKMPLVITENGWADQRIGVDPRRDAPRAAYHSVYLKELLRVQRENDVKVLGYMVWSLLDSYEWTAHFRFGLVHVDYETGSLNRTLKDSAWFFQYIGKHRKVPMLEYNYHFSSASTRTVPLLTVVAASVSLWLV